MSRLSLLKQAGALLSYFPKGTINRTGEQELVWTHSLTPTPLSNSYKVQLHYKRNKFIKVKVLDPKPLPLAKGKKKLPHVYSTPQQELCLYYPKDKEWDTGRYYVCLLYTSPSPRD